MELHIIEYINVQFSVTDSQRDLVSNYARSEREKGGSEKRINLNLYGNKFYSGSKEKHSTGFGKQNKGQDEGIYLLIYYQYQHSIIRPQRMAVQHTQEG